MKTKAEINQRVFKECLCKQRFALFFQEAGEIKKVLRYKVLKTIHADVDHEPIEKLKKK